MTSTKKRVTVALVATILATNPATPATAAEGLPIQVSSYKGSWEREVASLSAPAEQSTPSPLVIRTR